MSKMARLGMIPAVAVMALGLGLWFMLRQPAKASAPAEKLTIATYAGAPGALIYLAQERGFFANHGLDVTVKPYEAGKLATEALLAGEADIATTTDFVLVCKSFVHDDLNVLGTVALTNTRELVARKDRGISQPDDLRGKKVGVTRRSTGEFYLGTFLTFQSLSMQDVEIVDLKPSKLVEAIVKGDIDAAFTWNPNVFQIKNQLGTNAISWPGQAYQDVYFLLLAQADWIRAHPSTTERLLKSLLQAQDFVKNNDEKAKAFVARYFHYSTAYVEAIWPNIQFQVTLPQALLVVLEDQARWRIENRLTAATKIPNYLNFLSLEALLKVRAETVTVIR